MGGVGAVIGVKDEADLIGPCIERLRAIGVGPIVVLDDHSTDGTAEIVDALARSDQRLRRVTFVPDLMTNLARRGPALTSLIDDFAAEWVLFTDADEFWICARDPLDSILQRQSADVVIVDRFNVPLFDPAFQPKSGMDERRFLDTPLIVQRASLNTDSMRESRDQRWVMHAINPKVVCRARVIHEFNVGAHMVRTSTGEAPSKSTSSEVVIAHVPFTTKQRFRVKVENARHFFDRWISEYPGDAAWHWKRWIEIAEAGELDSEFERQKMTPAEMQAMCATGAIATARELFQQRAA
jgi:hypothetical protein